MNLNIFFPTLILLSCISSVFGAALKSVDDGSDGLYSIKDDVEILIGDGLKRNVYNSNSVWLVEFYSSWCGFCQRFAPTWKEFATDIRSWKDIVVVAAMDCSNEINNPVCIAFNITRYPTVRYFPDNYLERPDNLGWSVAPGISSYDHRKALLDVMIADQATRPQTVFPNIQPYTGEYSKIFNSISQEFCILIIQEPSDTIGPEMILDFYKVTDLCVKYAYKNNTKLVTHLGTNKFPSMYLIERNNIDLPLILTVYSSDRNGFNSAIRRVLQSKNIDFPEDSYVSTTTVRNEIDNNVPKTTETSTDVYQVDLESALRYSLNHEIASHKSITGEKLQALKNYISIIEKYFPLGPNGTLLFKQIGEYINNSSNIIDGTDISNMVKNSESGENRIFSSKQGWIGCSGSTPWYRGYPCGVWKMFHYFTVNSALQEKNVANSNPKAVLNALYGYVKHFFACAECSMHFQEMAERRNIFEIKSWDESILWLWKAHNEVNRRLAGDPSEDPQHPKIQFPPKQKCPNCFNVDGSSNEYEALRFLNNMYNKNNIKYDGADVSILNLGAASRSSRLYSTIGNILSEILKILQCSDDDTWYF